MSQVLLAGRTVGPEQTVRTLGLTLPPPRLADRLRLRRVGELLYTPGILPWWGDELRHARDEAGARQASRAARLCVLNIVSLAQAELGSLDHVMQVIHLSVLVAGGGGIANIGRVADGASQALVEIFGTQGRHHREVISGADLPHGAPVQVAAVLRVV